MAVRLLSVPHGRYVWAMSLFVHGASLLRAVATATAAVPASAPLGGRASGAQRVLSAGVPMRRTCSPPPAGAFPSSPPLLRNAPPPPGAPRRTHPSVAAAGNTVAASSATAHTAAAVSRAMVSQKTASVM